MLETRVAATSTRKGWSIAHKLRIASHSNIIALSHNCSICCYMQCIPLNLNKIVTEQKLLIYAYREVSFKSLV